MNFISYPYRIQTLNFSIKLVTQLVKFLMIE